MNKINFTKMHGLGNDFVLIDDRKDILKDIDLPALAKKVCNRHFGIGADGLILVLRSEKADYRMRIFNPDGSEAEMCGNGVRCFAKYIYESTDTKKEIISVETGRGIILPAVISSEGSVVCIEVDMGEPILHRKLIPMTGKDSENVINEEIKFDHRYFVATVVSMGNPHCVIFTENLEEIKISEVGPKIENSPLFPQRTNVEFVKILNEKELEVRIWERGVGETLACGTGACACVVAGVLTGKVTRKAIVHLPGGALGIEWSEEDDHVFLTGPAETVFEGNLCSEPND